MGLMIFKSLAKNRSNSKQFHYVGLLEFLAMGSRIFKTILGRYFTGEEGGAGGGGGERESKLEN